MARPLSPRRRHTECSQRSRFCSHAQETIISDGCFLFDKPLLYILKGDDLTQSHMFSFLISQQVTVYISCVDAKPWDSELTCRKTQFLKRNVYERGRKEGYNVFKEAGSSCENTAQGRGAFLFSKHWRAHRVLLYSSAAFIYTYMGKKAMKAHKKMLCLSYSLWLHFSFPFCL